MLTKITSNPKLVFLLDCLGALLSAFLLGVVLPSFQPIFGMPNEILYGLATLAALFAIYSFWNYRWFKENWRPYLRGIALINLTYCALTLALVLYFYSSISVWGLLYFLLEIVIVVALAIFELQAVRRTSKTGD
jgi:hypothetical protein